MDLLIMGGIKVDAIITDLPYGTTKCPWDIRIPFKPMWERIDSILKPNGAVVLFGAEPFSSMLRMSNLKNYKYDWVWEKTTVTGHLNAKKQPMRCAENISVFYAKPPTYNPQKTDGHPRKVSSADHKRNSAKTAAYGDHGLSSYDSTERYPRQILVTFKTDKQTDSVHTTQKPVALMEYLIKTYTNEGETVLDFTMGSGSTGVASVNTNRGFIGIENNYDIFLTAEQRVRV